MAEPKALLVLSTCPQSEAPRLARLLVEGGYAACVNVLEKVESFYFWEGKLCQDAESLLLVKTAPDRLPALTSALLGAHPYQVPEVIALEVAAGNPRYLAWVEEMSRPRPEASGGVPGPAPEGS
jgi:periplasmic divalent cation tolerance protein